MLLPDQSDKEIPRLWSEIMKINDEQTEQCKLTCFADTRSDGSVCMKPEDIERRVAEEQEFEECVELWRNTVQVKPLSEPEVLKYPEPTQDEKEKYRGVWRSQEKERHNLTLQEIERNMAKEKARLLSDIERQIAVD
jgi:hypothetical protein